MRRRGVCLLPVLLLFLLQLGRLRAAHLPTFHEESFAQERLLFFIPWAAKSGAGNVVRCARIAFGLAKRYNRTLVLPALTSSHVNSTDLYVKTLNASDPDYVTVRPSELLLAPEFRFTSYLAVVDTTLVRYRAIQDVLPFIKEPLRCWEVRHDSLWADLERKYAETLDERVLCIGNPFPTRNHGNWTPLREYFDFSGTVKGLAKLWMAQNGLVEGQYVAVHVRRGDHGPYCDDPVLIKNSSCFPLYSTVQRVIKGTKELYNVSTVFVATNENDASNLAMMKNLGWVYMRDFNKFTDKVPFYAKLHDVARQRYRQGINMLLVEQCIAVYSGVFIYTPKTTFSAMIAELRECSERRPCRRFGDLLDSLNSTTSLNESAGT
jgi:hypothetical protein